MKIVLEDLKQRTQVKATKIKRYDQRIEQHRINRLFHQNQKIVYQHLHGKLRAAKSLRQKKVGDFRATFGKQEEVNKTGYYKNNNWSN